MSWLSLSAIRSRRPAPRPRRRPALEPLEPRDVPASLVPTGAEFQVAATDDNSYPLAGKDVAMNAAGSSVVEWGRYDEKAIWVQRYDPSGNPAGGPLTVASTTTDFLVPGYVAIDGSGNFVVGWRLQLANPPDPDTISGPRVEKFNWAGQPLGMLPVPSGTRAGLEDIAMNNAGAVVIAWAHNDEQSNGAGAGIAVSLYTSTYSAAGQFQATTLVAAYNQPGTPPDLYYEVDDMKVARTRGLVGGGNGWVVTWGVRVDENWGTPNEIDHNPDINYARYSEGGALLGTGLVNQTGNVLWGGGPGQNRDGLAIQDNGDFVVTWMRTDNSVAARRFGSVPTGEYVVLAGNPNQSLYGVDVAVDALGRTVYAYATDSPLAAGETEGFVVYQDGPTQPLGAPQLATTGTVGHDGINPQLAMSENGQVLVIWDGEQTVPPGVPWYSGIFARRYQIQ
jgi:hypothetical protein